MTLDMWRLEMFPQRKVALGGLAGAVSIVLVWILGLCSIKVPPEVASAITAIMTFLVSYFIPDTPKPEPEEIWTQTTSAKPEPEEDE